MQEDGSYGRLRSFLAWTLLTCWTLLLAPVAIFSCVFDRGVTGWKMARYLWATAWLRLFSQTVEVVGAESVSEQRPAVYVANHASFLDVPALFFAMPINLRFLGKKSLRWYPAIGAYLMASGHVFVDRSDPARARASLAAAAEKVRAGTSILIFPEGTRSPDGRVQPFKKGAFVLAIAAGVPLIPITVSGTHRGLGRRLRPIPGRIRVEVGAPLSTEGLSYEDRDTLKERAAGAIASRLQLPGSEVSSPRPDPS